MATPRCLFQHRTPRCMLDVAIAPSSSTTVCTASLATRRQSPQQHQHQRTVYTKIVVDPKQYSKFLSPPSKKKSVSIIGAPLLAGQPLLGVDKGPDYIRQAGLIKRLQNDDWNVRDLGNLDFDAIREQESRASTLQQQPSYKTHPRAKNAHAVGTANQQLYNACAAVHDSGEFCLTLGGDHSIAIGSLSAVLKKRPNAGILWVDAHPDINHPSISGSGNIHGMVFSFLMNSNNVRAEVPYFDWMDAEGVPAFDPRNNLVYIGLRDVDAGEKEIIKRYGIKAFTMYDVDKYGIAKVMEMAFDHVLNRVERPLHLSYDIDSVDPTFAPSTGTRVAGGLTYREAYYINETIAETGCLVSMDLAEVNPQLDEKGAQATVDMATGLIASALGNTIM